MATGVLIVGVGRATRLLGHLSLHDKDYLATARLGQSTDTDDAEGQLTETRSSSDIAPDAIANAARGLVGDIEQRPPGVSAIKVEGKRAYARVRAGEDVVLAPRRVHVERLDVLDMRSHDDVIDVDFEVRCSSGTYVRALARDLGAALDVGGHLTALRRTRVGPFNPGMARTLDELAELDDPVTLPLPEAVRAAFPVREVSDEQARELSFGRFIEPRGVEGVHAAMTADGEVVALLREQDGRARPVLVFAAQ